MPERGWTADDVAFVELAAKRCYAHARGVARRAQEQAARYEDEECYTGRVPNMFHVSARNHNLRVMKQARADMAELVEVQLAITDLVEEFELRS